MINKTKKNWLQNSDFEGNTWEMLLTNWKTRRKHANLSPELSLRLSLDLFFLVVLGKNKLVKNLGKETTK